MNVTGNFSPTFAKDCSTNLHFLVDIGAGGSVYPHSIEAPVLKRTLSLQAVTTVPIRIYGRLVYCFDLALGQLFILTVVLRSISTTILGADFLSYYGLLVTCDTRYSYCPPFRLVRQFTPSHHRRRWLTKSLQNVRSFQRQSICTLNHITPPLPTSPLMSHPRSRDHTE